MSRILKFFDARSRFEYLSAKGMYNWMDDARYIRKMYSLIYGRELNLDSPTLFTEKLQWLKLQDRNPLYPTIVDKYKFKSYVGQIIGEEYLFPTIGVYEHFDDIEFATLPEKFVMKTNHDSGGVIICRDKSTFDKNHAKKILEAKLRKNYYWGCREWCYKNVKPLIIIEPFVSCKNSFNTDGLVDYKFYCFSGQPIYVMVSFGEAEHRHINHKYDLEYKSIDFKFREESLVSEDVFPKPDNFDKMVEIVSNLCTGFPHIRVDLYNVNGKIYVGELTLYSNGGFISLPYNTDAELGEKINLNLAYK